MAKSKNGKAKRRHSALAQQIQPVQKVQFTKGSRRMHWTLGIIAFMLMVCGAVAATTYSKVPQKAHQVESKTWGLNSTGGPRDRVTYSDGEVDTVAAGLLHVGDVLAKEDGTSQTVDMVESEAPQGVKPIEKIEVGEMVKTSPDPAVTHTSAGEKSIDDEQVDAQTWRDLKLVMREADGSKTDIRLLRPTWWINKNGIQDGRVFYLKIPEMHKEGPTTVSSIAPLTKGETYGKGTVTGTFKHEATNVVNLQLASLKQPLGVTTSHPFYSLTRGGWTSVGSLKVGEEVKTDVGKTKVVSIEPRVKSETVYNIEVHGDHTYFVGGRNGGAWVHNACPDFAGDIPEMADAPLRTQQVAVSWPMVQRLVKSFRENGWDPKAAPIQVDPNTNIIVEGNHRYIAGRIVGIDVPTTPSTSRGPVVPWSDVTVDPVDWDPPKP